MLNGGDVQILDLTQSNVTQAAPSGTVAIVVPRETLDQALPAPGDLHGLILRGQSGMGGLLADYMRSLVARADSMTMAEAPLVAQATTDMIAACFQSTTETTERARAAIDQTMRQRIQRHITAHLDRRRSIPKRCAPNSASRAASSTGCSSRWAASRTTSRSSG